MRHRLVAGAFFAAFLRAIAVCIALVAGPASAVTISYLQDLREIQASSNERRGDDFFFYSGTAQPSPEFSDFSDGFQFPHGEALQTSLLSQSWMYAQGRVRGEADLNIGGSGISVFHVVFTVDETAPWRLQGSLARPLFGSSGDAQVILSSGGTVLFAIALPPATDPNPLSVPASASGELTPGEYDLLIEARSAPLNPGIASFQIFFYVPEPTAGLLVMAGLLGLAAWRRPRA